ncbi:hypothetical protein BWL13_01990 [Microbacterium oleivorans]|uniref:hypothetical protein n=1 Tax=Microbacterium oleivorans TaxID=273677 RepID=UPI000977BA83|nr:hypothetical protein [Microbacterium oleivorans]AZS44402.1 hypothetical protein BWL13_01990 [Microbacterium oleivorans]
MTEPSLTLFTAHPSGGQSTLIQYNQHMMSERLVAVGYADAARRLSSSYRGEPWDDVMLLPFLFVWRQAIELQLKINIRDLATLRRKAGETDERLKATAVDERLRNPRKVGHNLTKLIAEHNEHIDALDLDALPSNVQTSLELLAALDEGGTGFRYGGVLKAPSADLDFRSMNDALDAAFRILEVVIDAATYGEGV